MEIRKKVPCSVNGEWWIVSLSILTSINDCIYLCFSSTGDGGTLTEITDGNQRINCDTWGRQIPKAHRWALDNPVARPGCRPTGIFSSIKWHFNSIASYRINIMLLERCTWRFVLCEFSSVTLFQTILLCTFFTLNVEQQIRSKYSDF